MSPDKKFSFFENRPEFDEEFISHITKLVVDVWTTQYAQLAKVEPLQQDKGKQVVFYELFSILVAFLIKNFQIGEKLVEKTEASVK